MIARTMNPKKKSSRTAKLSRALHIILVGLFGIQATLLYLAQRDVELPDFVCKWMSEKFAPAGTRLEIGGGVLRRLAFLELRRISIAHSASLEPTISLRTAGVYFNWKNFIKPDKNVQTFFFDGLELRCPGSLSQTGKPEIVLSDGRINASYSFGEINLKDAVARVGKIPFYASGAFNFSLFGRGDAGGEDAGTTERGEGGSAESGFLAPVFGFAGTLSSVNRRLDALDADKNTCLQLVIEPDEDDNAELHADLFCEALRLDDANLSVNKLHIHGELNLDSETQEISLLKPIRASAERVACGINEGELFDAWTFAAEEVDCAVRVDLGDDFGIVPRQIAVSALSAEAENFLNGKFPIALFFAESRDFDLQEKTVNATVNMAAFGTSLATEIDFSAVAGTRVVVNSEIDFPKLIKIPRVAAVLPEDIHKLEFGENPNLRADVVISPEFDFVRADYVLDADAVRWDTLKANTFFSYGSATKDELDIGLVRASGERYCSNVRMFFELKPAGKYRVQAFGSTVNPEVLDDYLGWFWWRIWNNLSIPSTGRAPRADIDVYGTLDPRSRWEYIYGAIAGENAESGGVIVDKVSLRVAEEPSVIAAFDMHFKRGNDHVAGTLQWHYAVAPEYHFRDFRFGFSGSMPPADVFNIVGEGLPEIFGGVLEREASGSAVVRGFVSGDEFFYPRERVLVEVDVRSAPGAFKIFDIEGSDFVGKINYDSGNIRVAPFESRCGSGKVGGEILVLFPPEGGTAGTHIAFDLKISEMPKSDFSTALEKLAALGKEEAEVSADSSEAVSTEKTEDFSKITAAFKGELTLPDIKSLAVSGQIDFYDPKLFDLQIFGGFSRFLETLKIPLTSFALTDAHTDFTVEGGRVYLPNLQIYGESGELNVRCNVDIETQALEGDAVFKNRRFTQIPILGKFVDWASETTSLVPVELSGTLDDVKWKLKPFSNFNPNRENHGEAPSSRKTEEK